MKNIARIDAKEREALFRNTAAKMGLSEAVVEKDFWVCYMLDYLFQRCQWKEHFAFKGGTSLSKAYNLINRFSEDIDIILDWRALGYGINEPWIVRSNTKQDAFNKEANKRAADFLRNMLLPAMITDLSADLAVKVECEIDQRDDQTIRFAYPNSFSDASLLQEIWLEIGALAAWTPALEQEITPYAAEYYGRVFEQPSTSVLTVLPERTFWEKVTILHREAFRGENNPLPPRYSRHYYDLFCMMSSPVKDHALEDEELLERVVAFKEKFYRCPWARYDLAKRETMRLMPPEHNVNKLREDYAHMQNMIFGEKPTFETIMDAIFALDNEINSIDL